MDQCVIESLIELERLYRGLMSDLIWDLHHQMHRRL